MLRERFELSCHQQSARHKTLFKVVRAAMCKKRKFLPYTIYLRGFLTTRESVILLQNLKIFCCFEFRPFKPAKLKTLHGISQFSIWTLILKGFKIKFAFYYWEILCLCYRSRPQGCSRSSPKPSNTYRLQQESLQRGEKRLLVVFERKLAFTR